MENTLLLSLLDRTDCAITVSDTTGTVIYMNERAQQTFSKNGETMVGKNMLPCHSEASRQKIHHMLEEGSTNCYTIEKRGIRKLIFQTPWRDQGEVKGLVEISIVLPNTVPHYVRS